MDAATILRDIVLAGHCPADFKAEAAFARVAARNAVDLLVANRCPGMFVGDDIASRLRRAHMLEEMAAELCERGVRCGAEFLFIKTFPPYPYCADDLDVVVINARSVRDVRVLFESLGYVYYPSRSALKEPDKRFFLRASERFRTHARLHAHLTISWNGVAYLDKHAVWARHVPSQRTAPVPIPSPLDEALIAAAHAVFETRALTLADLTTFQRFTDAGCSSEEARECAVAMGWGGAWDYISALVTELLAPDAPPCAYPYPLAYTRMAPLYLRKFAHEARTTATALTPVRGAAHLARAALAFGLPLTVRAGE